MPFRFVHSADIHLDSPLRSLALRNPDLAELVGDASRQALIAIVDLCLEEQVDALVIAGDLYDGDQTSMKTARFWPVSWGGCTRPASAPTRSAETMMRCRRSPRSW